MLKWIKISSIVAISAMVGATAGVAVEKHFFETKVAAVQQTVKHVTQPKKEQPKPKPQPESEQSVTQSKPKQEQQQEPKSNTQTDHKSQTLVHRVVSDGPTKKELRSFWNRMLELKAYLDERWDGNEYALVSPVEGNALFYIKNKLESINVPDNEAAKKYHMVFLDCVTRALIAVRNGDDVIARRIINQMNTDLQLLFPDEYKPASD